MDLRYQVFISSTFADLKEERRILIETILKMNCIPVGMELFPAADDEQFDFIKKVIDDSDYYLLIIGGRYGSESAGGTSFTELEYEYACKKEIPILAFIHANPGGIIFDKSEKDPTKRQKLQAFREKVSADRIIKEYDSADKLAADVILSLANAFMESPAIGWIRGGKYDNTDLLKQINELRLENKRLTDRESSDQKYNPDTSQLVDLAFGDELVELSGRKSKTRGQMKTTWTEKISWNEVFSLLGPHLFSPTVYAIAKSNFEKSLRDHLQAREWDDYFYIDDDRFQMAKIQLLGLNLIRVFASKTTNRGLQETVQITEPGIQYLVRIKGVSTSNKK